MPRTSSFLTKLAVSFHDQVYSKECRGLESNTGTLAITCISSGHAANWAMELGYQQDFRLKSHYQKGLGLHFNTVLVLLSLSLMLLKANSSNMHANPSLWGGSVSSFEMCLIWVEPTSILHKSDSKGSE